MFLATLAALEMVIRVSLPVQYEFQEVCFTYKASYTSGQRKQKEEGNISKERSFYSLFCLCHSSAIATSQLCWIFSLNYSDFPMYNQIVSRKFLIIKTEAESNQSHWKSIGIY